MIELLHIIGMGIFDRLRGRDSRTHTISKFVYGWIIASLVGHAIDVYTIPIVLAMVLGMSFGWGSPIGRALFDKEYSDDDLESWQVGPLKENVWLALAARGFMWGGMVIPILFFTETVLPIIPAFTIALPLAVYAAKQIKDKSFIINNDIWGTQEVLRGLIAGILIIFFSIGA